MKRLTIFAPRY